MNPLGNDKGQNGLTPAKLPKIRKEVVLFPVPKKGPGKYFRMVSDL
jgi:hypothetical protein